MDTSESGEGEHGWVLEVETHTKENSGYQFVVWEERPPTPSIKKCSDRGQRVSLDTHKRPWGKADTLESLLSQKHLTLQIRNKSAFSTVNRSISTSQGCRSDTRAHRGARHRALAPFSLTHRTLSNEPQPPGFIFTCRPAGMVRSLQEEHSVYCRQSGSLSAPSERTRVAKREHGHSAAQRQPTHNGPSLNQAQGRADS